jgi:hypothetical protein
VGFARPDIADAALHHFVGSDRVNITDKLDFSFFTCFAAERKVVITGVLLSLQSLLQSDVVSSVEASLQKIEREQRQKIL